MFFLFTFLHVFISVVGCFVKGGGFNLYSELIGVLKESWVGLLFGGVVWAYGFFFLK